MWRFYIIDDSFASHGLEFLMFIPNFILDIVRYLALTQRILSAEPSVFSSIIAQLFTPDGVWNLAAAARDLPFLLCAHRRRSFIYFRHIVSLCPHMLVMVKKQCIHKCDSFWSFFMSKNGQRVCEDGDCAKLNIPSCTELLSLVTEMGLWCSTIKVMTKKINCQRKNEL